MTFTKPILAALALGALVACEQVAPATPEPTPGPAAGDTALNGTYNLRASECDETDSPTSLVIDGNRFLFPGASCTVASSETEVNRTRVTLSCSGSPAAGNRVVELQSRPGQLRMTENSVTLTYYQCMRAQASTDSLQGQTM